MRLPLACCLCAAAASGAIAAGVPASSKDLFEGTRVWNIQLKFTAEQWAAMEPVGGPERGPGGPGGPRGGPGRGPGGPGGMSPAGMLVPAFLKGDANGDGALTVDEFRNLGADWFAAWSKGSGASMTVDQFRAGLQSVLPAPPAMPGGPGGPGGGGPGGRGPGMGFLAREGARNGMSGAMGIDFPYVRADMLFEDQALSGVAVRYKGNNTFQMSRNSIKRSFKIDFNKFDKKLKFAGITTLNLHNNVTDGSWMNEPLSYRLFRDAGVPSPRTAYARVHVTVPGKYDNTYLGLYSAVENIDGNFAKENYQTKDGAIFKPVARDLFGYLGDDWDRYDQLYDPKTTLTNTQKARVIEFAKFLQSAKDEEFAARAGDFLDLEEFARFMAATVMLSNMDSILAMGQNYYVYLHPETNKFQFLPWDLDHSFGNFPMAGGDGTQLSISQPWQGQNRFLQRVFQVPAFQKIYRARLQEMNARLYAKDRIAAQVDETAKAIRASVAEESETKLQRFDRGASAVSGAPAQREGRGFPGGPGGPGGMPIKSFVAARAQSISDQLAGKQPAVSASRRGPGGPGFNPALIFERGFLAAFDVKDNHAIGKEQFLAAFARWFESWNSDHSGRLTEAQLRTGLERDMVPRFPLE
ncbi:MAG: CotH kinase family protein [Acidobacteria bacterium]|nr:CotH kinase family protein [Acidobacteriota bacterium]